MKWKLLIFLLIGIDALAQKPQYVSLEKYTLEYIRGSYRVERVIDAREDTTRIGYTHKGMMNVHAPAFFQTSAEKEFQSLFLRSFAVNAATPLIIRINHLDVYEFVYSSKQLAFAELNLSFIIQGDGSYFELFRSAVIMEDALMDVSRAHAYNIVLAIQQSFLDFEHRIAGNRIWKEEIQASTLHLRPLEERSYKILSADSVPRCLFHTFYDFRDFHPDRNTDFAISLESWGENSSRATIRSGEKNAKIKDVWGFSDGKKLYMRIGNRYHPLERKDSIFTLNTTHAQVTSSDASGVAVAGFLGGVIGVLIYYSINPQQKELIECKVDFTHGGLTPVNTQGRKYHGQIYFYFTSYSKPGEITLSVDGKQYCAIARGSYYLFRGETTAPQIEICLQASNGETACQKINSVMLNSKVYLCKIKDDKPRLETLGSEIESSVLNDIQNGKYERSCK